MADEQKFTVTFTAQQLDYVGGFVVKSLNEATATAKMAQEVYNLLRASVQPTQPKAVANGMHVVPEVEVDVSPRSPIP